MTGYELTGFLAGFLWTNLFLGRKCFCKKWIGRIDFLHPNMPVIVFSVVLTLPHVQN